MDLIEVVGRIHGRLRESPVFHSHRRIHWETPARQSTGQEGDARTALSVDIDRHVVSAEAYLGTFVRTSRFDDLSLDRWRGLFVPEGEDRNGPTQD